jgi:hypothetical protein
MREWIQLPYSSSSLSAPEHSDKTTSPTQTMDLRHGLDLTVPSPPCFFNLAIRRQISIIFKVTNKMAKKGTKLIEIGARISTLGFV